MLVKGNKNLEMVSYELAKYDFQNDLERLSKIMSLCCDVIREYNKLVKEKKFVNSKIAFDISNTEFDRLVVSTKLAHGEIEVSVLPKSFKVEVRVFSDTSFKPQKYVLPFLGVGDSLQGDFSDFFLKYGSYFHKTIENFHKNLLIYRNECWSIK